MANLSLLPLPDKAILKHFQSMEESADRILPPNPRPIDRTLTGAFLWAIDQAGSYQNPNGKLNRVHEKLEEAIELGLIGEDIAKLIEGCIRNAHYNVWGATLLGLI